MKRHLRMIALAARDDVIEIKDEMGKLIKKVTNVLTYPHISDFLPLEFSFIVSPSCASAIHQRPFL